jgi:hypothetical protein
MISVRGGRCDYSPRVPKNLAVRMNRSDKITTLNFLRPWRWKRQCSSKVSVSTCSSTRCQSRRLRQHIAHLRQLEVSDFSGETFKGFEVLYFSMSATTTQLLSSGEFWKLFYDTVPVKSACANVSLYTSNSKNARFWVVTLLSQMSYMA